MHPVSFCCSAVSCGAEVAAVTSSYAAAGGCCCCDAAVVAGPGTSVAALSAVGAVVALKVVGACLWCGTVGRLRQSVLLICMGLEWRRDAV